MSCSCAVWRTTTPMRCAAARAKCAWMVQLGFVRRRGCRGTTITSICACPWSSFRICCSASKRRTAMRRRCSRPSSSPGPACVRALTALYPGKLAAVLRRGASQSGAHVPRAAARRCTRRTAGQLAAMCVPYGKILSGEVVPGTVTKTLHADKCFAPDGSTFSVVEYPGYNTVPNQVRTLKSFRRPVILVDDLLHKGYRIGKLNPIFDAEDWRSAASSSAFSPAAGATSCASSSARSSANISFRICTTGSRRACSIPSSAATPSVRPAQGRMLPSINLILPYFYPRHYAGATHAAVRDLSRTALENTLCVLRALEQAQQAVQHRADAAPPGRGHRAPAPARPRQCLDYDFSFPPRHIWRTIC